MAATRNLTKVALTATIWWFTFAAAMCAMLGCPWPASAANAVVALTAAFIWNYLYGRNE